MPPEPKFTPAEGVPPMSSGMSAERWLKISREKARRDEISRFNYARSEGYKEGFRQGFIEGFKEGFKEGFERGLLIGEINILSQQLGKPLADPKSLRELDLEKLRALLSELERCGEPPPA